jgi:hypothetical protein
MQLSHQYTHSTRVLPVLVLPRCTCMPSWPARMMHSGTGRRANACSHIFLSPVPSRGRQHCERERHLRQEMRREHVFDNDHRPHQRGSIVLLEGGTRGRRPTTNSNIGPDFFKKENRPPNGLRICLPGSSALRCATVCKCCATQCQAPR